MGIETNIFNWISIDLSPIVTLFRNNQGMARFEGKPGKPAHYVKYGVGPRDPKTGNNGGSDSIGWTKKIVTADMVGKPVAIFTAIEIKTLEGDGTPEQKNFIKQVREAGGYAGFASTKAEARDIVKL